MNKIYVVGIGPGAAGQMTAEAKDVLEAADIIVGYGLYIDLICDRFPGKEFLQNAMTGEVKRTEMALEKAAEGKRVAMISSGDAGIYGMAALVLEMAEQGGYDLEVEVVAGLTAASSGAAVLGAPLTHDFAVISLSDRLTRWEVIEKRLRAAGAGDFAVVLYNPRSKGRPHHLERAKEILLEQKAAETPVGIVRNIGREGEAALLTTLGAMNAEDVDMFATVFIGNRETYVSRGRMVTPRGYLEKGNG